MKTETFGRMVAALRKEKGMTQLELAEKMGVTDKAVSKWERDLSFPDVASLPKLAGIFQVTADELIQARAGTGKGTAAGGLPGLIDLAMKGVAVAMGIAVTVLSLLDRLDGRSAFSMLGIGLACLSVSQLPKGEG